MNIDEEKLKLLIGATIKKIEHYREGNMNEGYFVIFDNGLILTAQDGEYGDNTLEFVANKKYKNIKNKKKVR